MREPEVKNLQPSPKRWSSVLYKFLLTFATIAISYLVMVLMLVVYFDSKNYYNDSDKMMIIEEGASLREIATKLHQQKIIRNPEVFYYLSRLIKGRNLNIKHGEYFFDRHISYYDILQKMVDGNVFFRKLMLYAGSSVHTARDIIDNTPGLTGELPKNIAEGTLLPETYFYSYNDSKMSVFERAQKAMTKKLDELWQRRDLSIPISTKEEAVILASIVEKESGVESEKPIIASVFYNRIRKGMKLQSDPTIIYSYAFGDRKLERPITKSDIHNKSKFNTYNIFGLPPTPICNPSASSIAAVLNPAKTSYLYFVATGSGGHNFSSGMLEHNSYVERYREFMRNQKQKVPDDEASAPILDTPSSPAN